MKNIIQLSAECFGLFIRAHPELSNASVNTLNQMLAGEKMTYSKIAIDFAMEFMQDEMALKKREKK